MVGEERLWRIGYDDLFTVKVETNGGDQRNCYKAKLREEEWQTLTYLLQWYVSNKRPRPAAFVAAQERGGGPRESGGRKKGRSGTPKCVSGRNQRNHGSGATQNRESQGTGKQGTGTDGER